MKAEYEPFNPQFGESRFYLQAVELDSPDRRNDSLRFQFQDCTDAAWSELLVQFSKSLTQSTLCTFALCTQDNSSIVNDWPDEFKQFTDAEDLPVVARGLETCSVP